MSNSVRSILKKPGQTSTKRNNVRWGPLIQIIEGNGIVKTLPDRFDVTNTPQRPIPPPRPKTVQSQPQPVAAKEEGIHLQGYLERLETGIKATWVNCWCILTSSKIVYYNHPSKVRRNRNCHGSQRNLTNIFLLCEKAQTLGQLDITETATIFSGRQFHIDGGKFRKPAFQITAQGQSHIFSSSSDETISKWMRVVGTIIEFKKQPTVEEILHRNIALSKINSPEPNTKINRGSFIQKISQNLPSTPKLKKSKSREIPLSSSLDCILSPRSSKLAKPLTLEKVQEIVQNGNGFDRLSKATEFCDDRRKGKEVFVVSITPTVPLREGRNFNAPRPRSVSDCGSLANPSSELKIAPIYASTPRLATPSSHNSTNTRTKAITPTPTPQQAPSCTNTRIKPLSSTHPLPSTQNETPTLPKAVVPISQRKLPELPANKEKGAPTGTDGTSNTLNNNLPKSAVPISHKPAVPISQRKLPDFPTRNPKIPRNIHFSTMKTLPSNANYPAFDNASPVPNENPTVNRPNPPRPTRPDSSYFKKTQQSPISPYCTRSPARLHNPENSFKKLSDALVFRPLPPPILS